MQIKKPAPYIYKNCDKTRVENTRKMVKTHVRLRLVFSTVISLVF